MKTNKNNTIFMRSSHKTKKKPQKLEIKDVDFVVFVLYNTSTMVSLAGLTNK